jgi:microcystin-dependent protein
MSCSNCFNGCSDTVSDQCVKYTGVAIPALGIETGDTLSSVNSHITEFLLSALDGTGIILDIDPTDLCTIVSSYLPLAGDVTLVDYITALIKTACSLQDQITNIAEDVATINGEFTVDCLSGVTAASDNHSVVQAVINKLCSLDDALTALTLDVSTNYVKLSDLNALVDARLDAVGYGTVMSDKMIPYTAVEYYGSLSYFDITGAGLNLTGSGGYDWRKIYLCNGNNGTPDKRGRVPVGAIVNVGGVPLDAKRDPAISGNPNYALYTSEGDNTITLSGQHMPTHGHIATVVVTDPTHYHYEFNSDSNGETNLSSTNYPVYESSQSSNFSYSIEGTNTSSSRGKTSLTATGISVNVTNATSGSNKAHSNIQPVLGCFYIIFIP